MIIILSGINFVKWLLLVRNILLQPGRCVDYSSLTAIQILLPIKETRVHHGANERNIHCKKRFESSETSLVTCELIFCNYTFEIKTFDFVKRCVVNNYFFLQR